MTTIPTPPALQKPRTPQASLSPRAGRDLDGYSSEVSGPHRTSGPAGGSKVDLPSPFSDLSNLSIPTDPQLMYGICRYLATMSEVHKAYVRNMAVLGSTEPILFRRDDTGKKLNDDFVSRIKDLCEEDLHLKKLNQQAGVSYHTYNAAVVVLYFPFTKMLSCPECSCQVRADQTDWRLSTGGHFHAPCPSCSYDGRMLCVDKYILSERDIELQVLEMSQVHTLPAGMGSKLEVYYEIPTHDVTRLESQEDEDRSFILHTPQSYIEAALGARTYTAFSARKVVRLREDQYFLLRNVHLPMGKNGLPIPGFMASLKPYWQLRVFQRASEATSSSQIVPLDILYPESSSQSGNIFELLNVSSYMDVMRTELARHIQDPTYRPVMPFPVASHRVGGDGKAMLLSSEIRVCMEILCASLECPIEFIFGGLSYSGSDVSIQQVLQKLADYRADLLQMNRWVLRRICAYMNWPQVAIEFKDPRLGQDLPYLQFMAGLAGSGQVSWSRVRALLDIEDTPELAQIERDVEFEVRLNSKRARLDADMQENLTLRQGLAQAEVAVRGKQAFLEESLALAERVRRDPRLYQYVMGSSQSALDVFGDRAPEVIQTSALPSTPLQSQTPDPMLAAPGASAQMEATAQHLGAPPAEDLAGMSAQMWQDLGQPSVPEEIVAQVVDEIAQLEPEQWAPAMQEVAQRWGETVRAQVQAHLNMAGSSIGQRSAYAQGNRDEMLDYGSLA